MIVEKKTACGSSRAFQKTDYIFKRKQTNRCGLCESGTEIQWKEQHEIKSISRNKTKKPRYRVSVFFFKYK